MKVNIYLKTHLHHLILQFIETFIQSVKKRNFICLYILDTFLVRNLFLSCIMLFKMFSASLKSMCT